MEKAEITPKTRSSNPPQPEPETDQQGFLLNRARQSFICPGVLGARTQLGDKKEEKRPANGDCLLVDFYNNIFAVADSPERNPASSRSFLKLWAETLNERKLLNPRQGITISAYNDLMQELRAITEELMTKVDYFDRTTFTGLVVVPVKQEEFRGIILHGGDSFAYEAKLQTETINRITEANFWMLGRTGTLSQFIDFPIGEDSRIVLSSDGMNVLSQGEQINIEDIIMEVLQKQPIESFPDYILAKGSQEVIFYDDFGIIAINPYRLPGFGPRVIMGGTEFHQESNWVNEIAAAFILNEYEKIDPSAKNIIFIPT